MTKILITGGAGFIGSQLDYFFKNKGFHVTILDNMSYGYKDNVFIKDICVYNDFFQEDVLDFELKENDDFDYVLHIAGIAPLPDCQVSPNLAIRNNVETTAKILNECRKINIKRFIFASTSAVYENTTEKPFTEHSNINPTLIYPITKLQSEMLCRSFSKTYGIDVAILRFFNVYGPHQDYKRKYPPLTGYIIKQSLNNEPIILHSNGLQERDYVYVDDLLELVFKCLLDERKMFGEIFNVCSNSTVSVKQIVETMLQEFGKSTLGVHYSPATDFWNKYQSLYQGKFQFNKQLLESEVNKYTLGSYDKALRWFNWNPKISIGEGLSKIVRYALNDI